MTLADYSLNNPDTLTKYKDASRISESVLAAVSKLCVAGEKIVDICEKGDKMIEDEVAKVYRGKKVAKGLSAVVITVRIRASQISCLHGLVQAFPTLLLSLLHPTLPRTPLSRQMRLRRPSNCSLASPSRSSWARRSTASAPSSAIPSSCPPRASPRMSSRAGPPT